MNLIFCLLCLNHIIKKVSSQPYITYASGYFGEFDYTQYSFDLKNLSTYYGTVAFPGTFANDPKVIIFSNYYDMSKAINEFYINITSRSKTQCTFFIASTQPNLQRTFSYMFYWVALDDKRIEVFDYFNYNFTHQVNQDIKITHNNINALQGFVTVSSLGYSAGMDYSLEISSITLDTIIVSFKTNNTNLLSLGFQVVIGTSEAFTQSDLIKVQVSDIKFYQSGDLTIPTDYELFLPISAMLYANTRNIRLKQPIVLTASTVNYQYQSWDGSYFHWMTHQRIWMNKKNTKIYSPFLLKRMRVSRLFEFKMENPRWKLDILELDISLTAANTQTFLMDKNSTSLTVEYSYQCIPNGKISATILKCIQCLKQEQQFNYNCFQGINYITYYIQLQQLESINEYITFVVTNNGFTITESIINQNGSTTYTVLAITIDV